jgi:hypothetical protein
MHYEFDSMLGCDLSATLSGPLTALRTAGPDAVSRSRLWLYLSLPIACYLTELTVISIRRPGAMQEFLDAI